MGWDPVAHIEWGNAQALAAGVCQGAGMSHTARATYLWDKGPGRSRLLLCVECCARWRQDAADPDGVTDLPDKITLL